MVNGNIELRVLPVFLALLICGCGAPFKKFRRFDKRRDRIQTIALYPLHYSDDGEEERPFGMIFSENFFDSVQTMPVTRSVKFMEPDSTVSLLEAGGVAVTAFRADIVDGLSLPDYKVVRPGDLQVISKQVDALISCDLLDYKEGGVEEELGCACVTGLLHPLLFPGTLLSSGRNEVEMQIALFETTTGDTLWKCKPYARPPVGKTGEQRMELTQEIIRDFRECFPLSVSYKGN